MDAWTDKENIFNETNTDIRWWTEKDKTAWGRTDKDRQPEAETCSYFWKIVGEKPLLNIRQLCTSRRLLKGEMWKAGTDSSWKTDKDRQAKTGEHQLEESWLGKLHFCDFKKFNLEKEGLARDVS